MKIGFIIICRYNSRRLPGKILREINDKPILQYIYERIKEVVPSDNIVIATSDEPTDEPIAEFCKLNNYQLYRGSLNNVAERFLHCAQHYSFDYATRINGDNLFVDIPTLREMVEIAQTNKFDFISNVKNRTFPKGMSIEMVKTSYYKKQYQVFSDPEHFEHVTLYFYNHDKNQNFYYHYNTKVPQAAGIQMAIDTKEDFIFMEKIIHHFESNHISYDLAAIWKIYNRLKDM